jgi:hypothetical protein
VSGPVKKYQQEEYEDEEKEEKQHTSYKPSYGSGKVEKTSGRRV